MKILIVLFSMFFSVESNGQVSIDTSKRNVAYVIDGKTASPEEASNANVFYKNFVTRDQLYNEWPHIKFDTMYVIVTKQGAIAAYQKKLSAFSKAYKKEIEWRMKYNQNDDGIFYQPEINDKGEVYTRDERIRMLYNIPASDIKKVDVHKKGTNVYVTVTTKK
jgi:hypothetical protein